MGTQETRPGRLKSIRLILVALLLVSLAPPTAQADQAYTPRPGSAERKAVLNAVRAVVERGMKQKVIFLVDHIRIQGAWAFVQARPRSPSMKKLSFRGTRWEKDHREGLVDDGLAALLRKDAQGWLIVQWVMGPTDVAWEPWSKQFGAPKAIFR